MLRKLRTVRAMRDQRSDNTSPTDLIPRVFIISLLDELHPQFCLTTDPWMALAVESSGEGLAKAGLVYRDDEDD